MPDKNSSWKRLPWIILLSGVLLLTIIFFFVRESAIDQAPPNLNNNPLQAEIRLGISRSPLSAPLVVAVEQQFFEQEGLKPTLIIYDSGKAALDGLFNNEVDLAVAAPTPLVFTSFKRSDFRILAAIVSTYRDSKVLVRRDTRIRDFPDLRGRRVGVHRGTSGYFFLLSLLAEYGLDASDIHEQDIRSPDLPQALARHEVDAIAVWEPHAYLARQLLDDQVLELETGDSFRTTFNLVIKDDFATTHQLEIQAILRALKTAETFMGAEAGVAQSLVAERLDLVPKAVSQRK